MIYFILPLLGVLIIAACFVSSAYLVAARYAKLIRAARAAGRQDVERDLLASLKKLLYGKMAGYFLGKMLMDGGNL
jgi:hypothetical protein